jgi:hypothetical protein
MSIEFPCPNCQTLIRTPPGSEGKPARCPQCTSVVTVPGGTTAPKEFLQSPPLSPPPSTLSPPTHAPQKPATNPFADQPPSTNPYAAPAPSAVPDPLEVLSGPELEQRAYARLVIPAIGLLLFAVIGLGFMALVAFMATSDPDTLFKDVGPNPAERAGAWAFLAGYFGLGFLTRALQILGALAMLRVRGYGTALTGAICGLFPCEYFCCLPCFPLAIWALVYLNTAEVKAAFRR